MNKARHSVLMLSSPDQGQIFAFVLKLITNVYGKADEVCAYLMEITKAAPKKALIIDASGGNFWWSTQSEAFACIVGHAVKNKVVSSHSRLKV